MASEEYRHAQAGQKPGRRKPDLPATQPEFLSTGQVADLAEQLTGKRPSPSTITRWMLRGARGQRLPVHRIGGRLYTPRKAAMAWLAGNGGIEHQADPGDAVAAVSSLLGRDWGGSPSADRARRSKGGPA